jgi:hypothetical protein
VQMGGEAIWGLTLPSCAYSFGMDDGGGSLKQILCPNAALFFEIWEEKDADSMGWQMQMGGRGGEWDGCGVEGKGKGKGKKPQGWH